MPVGLIEVLLDGQPHPFVAQVFRFFYGDALFFFVFFVKREAHTASEVLLCM